jgi:glycosyltransferase involved in cell wall biosynthesis
MKLLYVVSELSIHGGIERVVTDKLNWLVEYGGCEVCLLLANQGENPIVFPLNTKVEYHDLSVKFHEIYHYSRLKRYYHYFRLHLIFRQKMSNYIHNFEPNVIVCTRLEYIYDVMNVSGDIPVVYEAHNSFLAYKYEKYSWKQRLQMRFLYRALKKVQMIVALTNGDALQWKRINSHIQVIPNVVHLNRTSRYSDCRSKSVIFVGRFSDQKDYHSLLQVWNIVSLRHADWQLNIYGGYGDQLDKLRSVIANNDANIVIHKPISSINDEYINNSLLLMTSNFEPFGLVLPEAMSCGLPVIAFDCPYGPADIITDGVDGFLVSNRDINSFANIVCRLLENEELRRKIGQAGIKSSQRYDACYVMPQWMNLFRELIS